MLDKEKFTEEYIKWLGGSLIIMLTHGVSIWREYTERKKAEKSLYDKIKLKISLISFIDIENQFSKFDIHNDNKYINEKVKEIILLNLNRINSDLVSTISFIEQFCIKYSLFDVKIYNDLIKITSEIKKITESKKIDIEKVVLILNELKKIIN